MPYSAGMKPLLLGLAFIDGIQGTESGSGLAQAVYIVRVVLQGAVVVPRGDGDRAEAERQPHVVVGNRVRRRIRLPRASQCHINLILNTDCRPCHHPLHLQTLVYVGAMDTVGFTSPGNGDLHSLGGSAQVLFCQLQEPCHADAYPTSCLKRHQQDNKIDTGSRANLACILLHTAEAPGDLVILRIKSSGA